MTDSPADTVTLASRAASEIRDVVSMLGDQDMDPMIEALAAARRIAVYGVGREGLMMKALTMRLFHMGLDAHVVGDMTTPPVSAGDLLLVSAGPGHFSTVQALLETARAAGAATACVTAQPDAPCPGLADTVLVIPAQTMADDTPDGQAAPQSILPMGSLYEGAQYVVFEVLILRLKARLAISSDVMRARHTNLE